MWNPLALWAHPGRIWRSLCYQFTGVVVGSVSFPLVVTLLATSGALLVTFPLALPVAWLTFVLAHGMAGVERSRLVSLTGVEATDPTRPLQRNGWIRRLRDRVTDFARWREILHHLLLLPVSLIGMALVLAVWCGSLAMVGLPLYVNGLPGDSAKFHWFEITSGPGALVAAGVGLAGLVLVAPVVTEAVTWASAKLARLLLGPTRGSALAAQVSHLESSRSAAVDSAESERRRIERDLHDGAQQRLVALAAELGAARAKLESDDVDGGRELVADAHEEAKAALKEIRDLVRGIHPVILEDRGLDAALSAVVARAPVPVALDVHVSPRPSAVAESTAYFVVNEALTNVSRHAQASRATVSIARAGDRLVIEVRDDGVGGADASRGTGLQGLRDRVAGVGGTMHVISPDGGPTTISVEVPCGS